MDRMGALGVDETTQKWVWLDEQYGALN